MLYQLFGLFLAFSFLGWCLEVAATAGRLGQYRDRGVLHGPLCLVYEMCIRDRARRAGAHAFIFDPQNLCRIPKNVACMQRCV